MSLSYIIDFISDPKALIETFGLIGVIAIIFLETGFFFGFFLPGDSLLFTAGLLASQGYMPLSWLMIGTFIAAVAGDSVGYSFGKRIGPSIFSREDSLLFSRKSVAKAQHFYETYGPQTILFARFIPIVRTFAPIVAGVGGMKYKTFISWNIVGGLVWTLLLIGMGVGFGKVIPDPDKYLLPTIGVIIAISIIPAIRQVMKARRSMPTPEQ